MYTFDRATATSIVGAIIGEQGNHIAVAVKPRDAHSGTLLAVRRDGEQYAVWSYVAHSAGVDAYGGHYFDSWAYGGAFEAFTMAAKELERVAS